jgi:hypothetical protein
MSATSPITTNSTVVLETSDYALADLSGNSRGALFCAFMSIAGPIFVPTTPVPGGYSIAIPPGVSWQTYVVPTSCNEKITDETTATGPAILEVVFGRIGDVRRVPQVAATKFGSGREM